MNFETRNSPYTALIDSDIAAQKQAIKVSAQKKKKKAKKKKK
jgi:hypothetical protein